MAQEDHRSRKKTGTRSLASSMPRCVPSASPNIFQSTKHWGIWIIKHAIQSSPALTIGLTKEFVRVFLYHLTNPPPTHPHLYPPRSSSISHACHSPSKELFQHNRWGEGSTILFCTLMLYPISPLLLLHHKKGDSLNFTPISEMFLATWQKSKGLLYLE